MAMLLAAAAALLPAAGLAAAAAPCRLDGIEHEALCGSVQRPLNPAAPQGVQIAVHYAVLPAIARNKQPDPVLFFAGGPGQSAIALAGNIAAMLARFGNRRDIVLIDQRGTGRSAPLECSADDPALPLAEQFDPLRQKKRLAECREHLRTLPYGDLRFFTTAIASADADAVRQALGAERVNLVGVSYGTRAALDYLRQFPQHVRRTVLDGVAPPDMVLPSAFSTDNQAALDALFSSCEASPTCARRHPALRAQWRQLLASLPREASVRHPLTGRSEPLTLSRDTLLGLVRGPLYAPFLASALPQALSEATQGRFEPLAGLAQSLGGKRSTQLAMGMHFSVVCAEDVPRPAPEGDRPGADFGDGFAGFYREVCAGWPRSDVPADFYRVPSAGSAVLLLSGRIDPATPPRHAERVAHALGLKARHVVVPNAGHGVMSIGCLRDLVYRFVDAASDEEALEVETGCAARLPRPPAFEPPEPGR